MSTIITKSIIKNISLPVLGDYVLNTNTGNIYRILKGHYKKYRLAPITNDMTDIDFDNLVTQLTEFVKITSINIEATY